ncbi:MAG: hypothetical protein WDM79_09520 [Terricaulis sp.]
MDRAPGFWTCALATGGAIAAQMALAGLFHITGRADVALMIAMIAGAVYLVTPGAQRGDAKRLWGMVLLAFVGLILSSGVGAMLGVSIAFSAIVGAETDAAREAGPSLVLAVAVAAACAAYLGVFRLGWGLVKPPETAPAAADWTKRVF